MWVNAYINCNLKLKSLHNRALCRKSGFIVKFWPSDKSSKAFCWDNKYLILNYAVNFSFDAALFST